MLLAPVDDAVGCAHGRRHVGVPKPQVQGEVRVDVPVVLEVEARVEAYGCPLSVRPWIINEFCGKPSRKSPKPWPVPAGEAGLRVNPPVNP